MRVIEPKILQAWLDSNGYSAGEENQVFTCITPLPRLEWFIGELLKGIKQFSGAIIYVSAYVFEPTSVLALFDSRKLAHPDRRYSLAYLVENKEEFERLLLAVYSDWSDFTVFVEPKQMIFTADHDEYSNFFTVRNESTFLHSFLNANGVNVFFDYDAPSPFEGIEPLKPVGINNDDTS